MLSRLEQLVTPPLKKGREKYQWQKLHGDQDDDGQNNPYSSGKQ